MKKGEPLKKRRGNANTKSLKKSKDEWTIIAFVNIAYNKIIKMRGGGKLMCLSAVINTQSFYMSLFPWMWETLSSHFRLLIDPHILFYCLFSWR